MSISVEDAARIFTPHELALIEWAGGLAAFPHMSPAVIDFIKVCAFRERQHEEFMIRLKRRKDSINVQVRPQTNLS